MDLDFFKSIIIGDESKPTSYARETFPSLIKYREDNKHSCCLHFPNRIIDIHWNLSANNYYLKPKALTYPSTHQIMLHKICN